MHTCYSCGSSLAYKKCYFCEEYTCSTCKTDDRSRCKRCYIQKRRLSPKQIIKKNKILLIFIGLLWFYAVFPGPFLPDLDPNYYYTTLIAAILIMIPVSLALFFWSLNPPSSDLQRKDRD